MAQAVGIICGFVESQRPAQVLTFGAEMAMLAAADVEYRAVINGADLVVPDTVGIVVASRMLGAALPQRVPGIELAERLCEHCARNGWPAYFYGGAQGVAQEAAANLARRHPGLIIAGTQHGFHSPAQAARIPLAMQRSGARLVFVALGFPLQDLWIRDHLDSVGPATCIGVGGTFDVLAGRSRRAPAAVRKAGLEWLYRLAREPRRLRRQLVLPRFAMKVAWEAVRRRLGTRSARS
ncbi:MAG: WecB/TagA/CpsF family glycosyltransferase [Candidatus Eremiobacteraeota bacterium]|nr:WecB/TagA/CpsF family glycosyltransferase [Candidatus Eremiobacteraeota bacterium]